MGRTFSEVLPIFACAHEFSWPRKMSTGEYYQVCLRCGAEYGYDWNTMRRTEKVGRGTAVQNRGQMNRASGWKPRARRIHLESPIQYRTSERQPWTEGVVKNVSQSGVYFVTEGDLPEGTAIEVIFIMPQEIAGQENAKVFCRGKLTRTMEAMDGEHPNGIAFEIVTCEYLHERRQPRSAETHV
jgi:hypothetical protein